MLLPMQEGRIEAYGGEQCAVRREPAMRASSLTAERQPPQMGLCNQTLEMPLVGKSRRRRVYDNADLVISKLRCFGEVRRSDIGSLAIDDDALRVQAGVRSVDLAEAALIVEGLRCPRGGTRIAPEEAPDLALGDAAVDRVAGPAERREKERAICPLL
jgi:hypothetical protein